MKLTSVLQTQESQARITATLDTADFATYRGQALQNLADKVTINGFRKGNVPENILVQHVGEAAILDEMAHLAITASFGQLVQEHNVRAVGRPEISITKLAPGNPLEFTVTTDIMPEITLPDYRVLAKKIAEEKVSDEVTADEVEQAITHLRRMRAQHTCTHEQDGTPCKHEITDADLPALDTAFVQTLGSFNDVDDFRAKLTENMREEKVARNHEKKRIDMIESIMEKTPVAIPAVLVSYELDKMMYQMEHDIAMSGLGFDEYLEKIEKTKDQLREEWKPTAEKRAKMHLIIREIAHQEKLEPSEQDIEVETKKILEQYKDTPGIDEAGIRVYVSGILENQKVFEFLEQQK